MAFCVMSLTGLFSEFYGMLHSVKQFNGNVESKCNTFFLLSFLLLTVCPMSRLCFRGSLLVLTFPCSLVSFVYVSFFLVCLVCFVFVFA